MQKNTNLLGDKSKTNISKQHNNVFTVFNTCSFISKKLVLQYYKVCILQYQPYQKNQKHFLVYNNTK